MADAAPAVDETAKAEAAYKAELAERVKRDAQDMGISTEEKKPEEPSKEEPKEPEAEESEKDDSDDPDNDPDYAAPDEDEEKPKDEKYSKALRRLQKQESELQQFKAQVLQQERDLKTRVEKQTHAEAELGQFIRSLQLDPYGTLMKAGLLTEDDAEYASKQLYFHSKAAAADPKSKAEADRLRREREVLLEAQKARREVEAIRREREEENKKAQQERATNEYIAKIDTAVEAQKSKHPLLVKALEKNPTRTRKELLQFANDLSYSKKEYADPSLVILAWVKHRKELLSDYGLVEPVAKSNQAKSTSAVEKKGQTNGQQTKQQKAQLTDEEKEAAFQKELRERLAGTYVEKD